MKSLIISLLLALLSTGCGTTAMYKGPKLEKSQVAFFYIEERPAKYYIHVDKKAVSFFPDGKVLEFKPGKHTIAVRLHSDKIVPLHEEMHHMVYEFTVDMKPGYSYELEDYPKNLHGRDAICILGEPHDAPGSSVNVTGEYRKSSSKAEKSCAKAAYYITIEGKSCALKEGSDREFVCETI